MPQFLNSSEIFILFTKTIIIIQKFKKYYNKIKDLNFKVFPHENFFYLQNNYLYKIFFLSHSQHPSQLFYYKITAVCATAKVRTEGNVGHKIYAMLC